MNKTMPLQSRFPMIGKIIRKVSNDWKNAAENFQSLEKNHGPFPIIGKTGFVCLALAVGLCAGSVSAYLTWDIDLSSVSGVEMGQAVQMYRDVNGDTVLSEARLTESGALNGLGNSSDDVLLSSFQSVVTSGKAGYMVYASFSGWSALYGAKVYSVLFNHSAPALATGYLILDGSVHTLSSVDPDIYEIMEITNSWHGFHGVPDARVISAAMRPGTTLMDIVYRVDDSDDTTVKVRALAFVDGVRSFANVIRPETFVEGTATNVGDAVTSGEEHTLTWDVGADWKIDLAQVKIEILCRDGRGLLPFKWITIPATTNHEAITISRNAPTDSEILNALFWQYAAGDEGLELATNGVLSGSASSGDLAGLALINGSNVLEHAPVYVMKAMDVQPANQTDVDYAALIARAGLSDTNRCHALNIEYDEQP